jgi:repressor LexA
MKHERTAKRLSKALANVNKIPQELANESGVSKSSISQYLNGSHKPSNISSGKMAKILGVDPLWLMGFDVPMKKEITLEPVSIGKTIRIPVYGRIPAGVPREAIEDIEDYIDVDADLAAKNDLLALKVVGNSMYPKYIDGDYVLIREQPDCENGQDCAVRVNGNDVTLKRVIKERDGIMLQPINPEYEPRKYDYTDEFNPVYIIGVVIELRRKI